MTNNSLMEITDEDIAWAVDTLRLPKNAFSPEKDGGARERILKSVNETLDISACPGSGKTTLLVAKLAIHARNWPYRRKGMCVLSHTNVAKEEIEKRLGGTEAGQALLSYPHYIGTIHGFINEFLALPWLRAKGYPINTIDSDIARNWRWNQLPDWLKQNAQVVSFSKKYLTIQNTELSIGNIPWRKGQLSHGTMSYKLFEQSCKKSVQKQGFHTFDEMFMWADELIGKHPVAKQYIRDRFPQLFLDEVQDNSEQQSSILYRIFMEGETQVSRLRFGDSDQEIFNYSGESHTVETDCFPADSGEQVFDLPNSHRFGQSIAKLASPLSVSNMPLIGQGPKGNIGEEKDDCHAIFLVNDSTANKVLDAYGKYLLSVFDHKQEDLNEMTFTAVGAVHRNSDKDDHKPRDVINYWSEYQPDISSKDPHPSTFLQYVIAGCFLAKKNASDNTGGESFYAVERLAIGILNKVKETSPDVGIKPRKRSHRFILELLHDDEPTLDGYHKMVTSLAIEQHIPSEDSWHQIWKPIVENIVTKISGKTLNPNDPFLSYPANFSIDPIHHHQSRHGNIYPVEHDGRKINIKLGSIHSVKGETHTGTLVLETYRKAHHLEKIVCHIKGEPKANRDDAFKQRLRLHYVAMTRPSHLLCLAMKKSTFEDKEGQIKPKEIEKLKIQGWSKVGIVDLNGDCDWL